MRISSIERTCGSSGWRDISRLCCQTPYHFSHIFWQQPLRVAFIDSSHHYEPTHAELKLILPLILDGGWLVLHDYFSEDTPGVGRAVDEVFESQDMNTFDFYRMDQLAIIRNGSSNPSAVSTTNATSESTGQATVDSK